MIIKTSFSILFYSFNSIGGGLFVAAVLGLASCRTAAPPAAATPPAPAVPTLVTIGSEAISPAEFFDSYNKNRQSADSSGSLSVAEYLEVFTNNRLKLLAARSQGRDTTSDYQEEIATYHQQLAAPYLTDQALVDELAREAFERHKLEVHAAHILVGVAAEAAPADTLSAYQAAVALRGRLLEGEDFGKMAAKFSKDPTAPDNRGDLGYFTAFQMVYPFESAAYLIPIGDISEPVRTQYGYELIKVIDRRPSRGKRRVAHVMIQLRPEYSPEKKTDARRRINEAYARLQKGEAWEKIVLAYSDDFQSRQNAGLLPPLSVGEADPAFEQAAYDLTQVGSHTKPVETPYGWHILRLIDVLPSESYEQMQPRLLQKVVTDSRGRLVDQSFADQLRRQYDVQENPDAWSTLLELADSTLVAGQWQLPAAVQADPENPVLFTIEQEAATTRMFLEYTKARLKPRPIGSDAKVVLRTYYNDFLTRQLLAFERNNLENKYPEFRQLMKDIRGSVLVSQVMEEQVWQRSLDDSTTQRQLYEQNLTQYRYPERALATVIEARDTTTLRRVLDLLARPPYPLQLMGRELLYNEAATQPAALQLDDLYSLTATLKKNSDYVVEVAGFRAAAEADTVSSARIAQVVRYLNAQGIPITRIMEKDYGAFRPVPEAAGIDRNRRVSFQLYSRSRSDLEKALNREQPGSVTISEGYFTREHAYFGLARWQEGEQQIAQADGKVLGLVVTRIEPARSKTFAEARGTVINAYQKILEKQWLNSLKAAYPVKIYEKELEKFTK